MADRFDVEAALLRVRQITAGIDKDQIDSDDGWWETSTGVEFGKGKLEQLEVLVRVLCAAESTEPHCDSCICGKRARVQPDDNHGGGTITWSEHEEAYATYSTRFGSAQTAQRIHDRGGFSYGELVTLLGHEPTTWMVPR